jgi:5-formyltetrahydrofolate cyclo-ligase
MKAALREQMKQTRLALSAADVQRRSAPIVAQLVELEAFRRAASVMLYLPVRNEVDTTRAVTACVNGGKVLVLPRMDYEHDRIVAHRVDDVATQLVLGRMDLVEPDPAQTEVVAPDEIELVVVPGLAFDRQGYRIGWGLGYYDAFLAGLGARAERVGLAYEFQVVDAVEHDGHDVPMDSVVTESGHFDVTTRGNHTLR